MINTFATQILTLPAWIALVLVFLVPALEASAFVGFVFPGEIALILGGVLAYEDRVPLVAVLAAGIVGAVVGDSVGYAVGFRWGRRLLDGTVGRLVNHKHLDRGEAYLAARGGKAVFLGRFTAALRVLMPGLAGMSRMPYRKFLAYNFSGGVAWAVMAVLLGYLAGTGWRAAANTASIIGLAVFGLVVLGVAAASLRSLVRFRASRASR